MGLDYNLSKKCGFACCCFSFSPKSLKDCSKMYGKNNTWGSQGSIMHKDPPLREPLRVQFRIVKNKPTNH